MDRRHGKAQFFYYASDSRDPHYTTRLGCLYTVSAIATILTAERPVAPADLAAHISKSGVPKLNNAPVVSIWIVQDSVTVVEVGQ